MHLIHPKAKLMQSQGKKELSLPLSFSLAREQHSSHAPMNPVSKLCGLSSCMASGLMDSTHEVQAEARVPQHSNELQPGMQAKLADEEKDWTELALA